MESHPQNPEFRNNPETFTHFITLSMLGNICSFLASADFLAHLSRRLIGELIVYK